MQRDSVVKFFAIELQNANDLELEWAKGNCTYVDRKSMLDFLFYRNCNVCPICYRLRDIFSQNKHDLDL